jgi:hypothetical protein
MNLKMSNLGYQTTAQTREVVASSGRDRDPQSGGPFSPFFARLKLSEQEREFVAAGLSYSPLLSAVWPWVENVASPVTAFLAYRGLSALEDKISKRLRDVIDADEESDLINDLHSVQLTRKRIRTAVFHPFQGT